MDLLSECVNYAQSEILNGKSFSLEDLMKKDNQKILESSEDEQLIINLRFKETVKITSLQIVGPDDESGPRSVKLFVNQQTIDFNNVDVELPTQTIEYESPNDYDNPVILNVSKFMKVTSLTIFIEDNIGGFDQTKVKNILLFGKGLATKIVLDSDSKVKTVINEEEYNKLKDQPDRLIVVDFTASWCPPCKAIAPIFDELSLAHPEVTFIKVDINACKTFEDVKDVVSVPTFKFFKNKALLTSFSGANKNQLIETIKLYK